MKAFLLFSLLFTLPARAEDPDRREAMALATLARTFAYLVDNGMRSEGGIDHAFVAMMNAEPYLHLAYFNPKFLDKPQVNLLRSILGPEKIPKVNALYPDLLKAWRHQGFLHLRAEVFLDEPLSSRNRQRAYAVARAAAYGASNVALNLTVAVVSFGLSANFNPIQFEPALPTRKQMYVARTTRGLGALFRMLECEETLSP